VWLNAAPVRWPLGPLLALLDLLVLNATEAAQAAGQAMGQATGQATGQAAGQATGQATPADAARALRSAVPSGTAVVVTLGGAGLIGPDGVCLPAPPLPAPPRDTTGAGDAFCGALAAALLRGHADPLGAAQAAAAISVGRDGCFASLPTSSELARVLGPG